MDQDGKLVEDPLHMANILEQQYKSVYSDPIQEMEISSPQTFLV